MAASSFQPTKMATKTNTQSILEHIQMVCRTWAVGVMEVELAVDQLVGEAAVVIWAQIHLQHRIAEITGAFLDTPYAAPVLSMVKTPD